MKKPLTRWEAILLIFVAAILVACSVLQNQRLQAVQLAQKQALYAERLRTAQVILENEMLAAAYLTTLDVYTRERAPHHLDRSPR